MTLLLINESKDIWFTSRLLGHFIHQKEYAPSYIQPKTTSRVWVSNGERSRTITQRNYKISQRKKDNLRHDISKSRHAPSIIHIKETKLCRVLKIKKIPLHITIKSIKRLLRKRSLAPASCSKELKSIKHDKNAIIKLREGATTRSQSLGFFW